MIIFCGIFDVSSTYEARIEMMMIMFLDSDVRCMFPRLGMFHRVSNNNVLSMFEKVHREISHCIDNPRHVEMK